MRTVTVADLFCGAGGSSTGTRRALERLGIRMKLIAVNHWPTAIKTHSKMHPDAQHFCVDLEHARPSELVPSGKLDLLMASPSCIHFSRARGGKPTSDQQRMSPWVIINWLTELRVKSLIVENVPEFQQWGPVDPKTGKALKSRRGEYFKAWVRAIEGLGFQLEYRVLNAADYGDATTRERFFLVGRSDGELVTWPLASHDQDGGSGLPRWRAAREVIDWSLKGNSIFRRGVTKKGKEKRLSTKTLARILAGAVKFGWPAPFVELLERYITGEAYTAILKDFKGRGLKPDGMAGIPLIARTDMHLSNAMCVRDPAVSPLATITTSNGMGVTEPVILAQGQGGRARPTTNPMPTIPGRGAHALVSTYYGNGGNRTADEPVATITAKDRLSLVVPVTHTDKDGRRVRSSHEPLHMITGANRGELAFAIAAFGERPGQTPRTHDLSQPVPAICAQGRVPLVEGDLEAQWDILFRMLQPHELAKAMGFSDDETTYEFAGNKTEVTRQIGNAVAVRTATALVHQLFAEQDKRERYVGCGCVKLGGDPAMCATHDADMLRPEFRRMRA